MYRDVSKDPNTYHVGLGVTAISTSHCLHDDNFDVGTWAVPNGNEVWKRLQDHPEVTHIIFMAPWIDTPWMGRLCNAFPKVTFATVCHSHVGFLQVDAWAVKTIQEQMDLERDRLNFHVAGNSSKYCKWVRRAYHRPCAYLPNMYWSGGYEHPKKWIPGEPLRIGIFGATRVLKNMGTAVAAAMVISSDLGVEMEIWVSAGRVEGVGGSRVIEACENMLKNTPRIKLIESPWQPWPQFRETIGRMHLTLQPSYSESFNNCSADSISMGVPVVASPAITWVPRSWQVNSDDPILLAEEGKKLLIDKHATKHGQKALDKHNRQALKAWRSYLGPRDLDPAPGNNRSLRAEKPRG